MDSFVNSVSNRDSCNQRDSASVESNQSYASLRCTIEGSERFSAMLRDSDECSNRQQLLNSETKKLP